MDRGSQNNHTGWRTGDRGLPRASLPFRALLAALAAEDGGCGAETPTRSSQAGECRPGRQAPGSERRQWSPSIRVPRVLQDRPPAAEQLAGQPSLAFRRLTPRPRPAPGLARLPRPSGPQPRLLSRIHYLPQANVARDGQSEGQCNVLHGLSHGSVQKPANTEVPPTAALRHAGNARGRLRRPGRAKASRARGRERASETPSRPVVFSFSS